MKKKICLLLVLFTICLISTSCSTEKIYMAIVTEYQTTEDGEVVKNVEIEYTTTASSESEAKEYFDNLF